MFKIEDFTTCEVPVEISCFGFDSNPLEMELKNWLLGICLLWNTPRTRHMVRISI